MIHERNSRSFLYPADSYRLSLTRKVHVARFIKNTTYLKASSVHGSCTRYFEKVLYNNRVKAAWSYTSSENRFDVYCIHYWTSREGIHTSTKKMEGTPET